MFGKKMNQTLHHKHCLLHHKWKLIFVVLRWEDKLTYSLGNVRDFLSIRWLIMSLSLIKGVLARRSIRSVLVRVQFSLFSHYSVSLVHYAVTNACFWSSLAKQMLSLPKICHLCGISSLLRWHFLSEDYLFLGEDDIFWMKMTKNNHLCERSGLNDKTELTELNETHTRTERIDTLCACV